MPFRHSRSDRIRVSLSQRDNRICIDVRDWGVGFDPAAVEERRFGLQGIRERVRLLEGRMAIESAPGEGTHISVELPLTAKDETLAVIFDMDGVLVDTYHAHYRSWLELAEAEGFHFTEAEFAATFGRTSREIIAHFWGEGRFDDAQIAELDRRKEAAFRRMIETDFPAMPGVGELLRSLHNAGFRLAVGSSGPPENVAMVLDRLEARNLFEAVVTGEDVTRGKPDPEVFLIAAKRLGVPPARCAVIEDAPSGIAAANAARHDQRRSVEHRPEARRSRGRSSRRSVARRALSASAARPDCRSVVNPSGQGGYIMKKSLGAKTILYPTPVLVVGTYDLQGKPNVMTAAWGGICCSEPPCVAVSLRKATYSYHNIVHRKAFTVSVPSERYVKDADYFGIVSGRTDDKFAAAELTAGPQRSGRCSLRARVSAGSRMPTAAHVRVGVAYAVRRRNPRRESRSGDVGGRRSSRYRETPADHLRPGGASVLRHRPPLGQGVFDRQAAVRMSTAFTA